MLKSVLNIIKVPLIQGTTRVQASPGQLRPFNVINSRFLHLTSIRAGNDRRTLVGNSGKRDEGVEGERVVDIDNVFTQSDIFPTAETPNKLFNNIPFKDIPIVHIKCSRNNTHMTLTDHSDIKCYRTCGIEGFKNARKGTNVAAQATAITFSGKVLNQGYKTVRVRVRGLGPGRMASIKGMQMSGLEIISITDDTRVSWHPPRPRKARRV